MAACNPTPSTVKVPALAFRSPDEETALRAVQLAVCQLAARLHTIKCVGECDPLTDVCGIKIVTNFNSKITTSFGLDKQSHLVYICELAAMPIDVVCKCATN